MLKAAVCVFLVSVLAVSAAYAAGGIYIDNFQVSNNGKVVFSDTFDSGKLMGWTKMSGASLVPDGPGKPQGALLLNKHIYSAATAYHNLSASDVGAVEMSADIYCTVPDEQYDRRVKKLACGTYLRVYSGSSTSSLAAKVQLNPCQDTYQLGIVSERNGNAVYTKCPVLNPGEWATLTLRLNPRTSTATLLLNGKSVISMKYNPRNFQSLREVGLVTGLGDGSKRTD